MPYQSASARAIQGARNLQYSFWVALPDFSAVYNLLQQTDLASATLKLAALTLFHSLTPRTPYVIADGSLTRPTDVRFSSTTPTGLPNIAALFICVDLSNWGHIFENINEALTSAPLLDVYADPAYPLFQAALTSISHNLSSSNGVFSYATFEQYFYLNWV